MTDLQRLARAVFLISHGVGFREFSREDKEQIELIESLLSEAMEQHLKEAWGKDDLDHFARVKRQAEREAYTRVAEVARDMQCEIVEGNCQRQKIAVAIERLRDAK